MVPGDLIGGRYELGELIGEGGEAKVFRARDSEGAGDVAVRFSQDVAEPSMPEEFHPGWVRLLDAGRDSQDGPYQVFELLEGETLGHQVKRAPFSLGAWREFVRQSLDAVAALHQGGWVHGDLNAENFLQARSGPWKLLEIPFLRGVSERPDVFGSIYTLAPEQLKGQPPDADSDLYALGCLYYYAASGEFPHPGATRQEVVISLLRFPPTPLGEKVSGWPVSASAGVMGLLAGDPAKRAAARGLLLG